MSTHTLFLSVIRALNPEAGAEGADGGGRRRWVDLAVDSGLCSELR